MKIKIEHVLFLAVSIVLVVILGGCSNDNELTIDQVDVVAKVMADGDLYVEELFTYTVQGEYERIPRYMDNFGGANIEFFEAYVPPNDRELGNLGYVNLERYPVYLRTKSGSYYIELQAKDETRQIYYRYRLDREAVKYDDRGELDWTVLKDNRFDHHNVTVRVYTEQPAKENLSGYAYDRSRGSLTEINNRWIRYENALLPEGDSARLKLYFPPEVLTERETEEPSASLSERLLDEQKLQQRFEKREHLLKAGQHISHWLTYVAIAGIVYYSLSLRRISSWWSGRRISFEDLAAMDPIDLIYLFRKGKLRLADGLAGVFSLRRKGMVSVSLVPSDMRFQEDSRAPKRLPEFTFKGNRTALKKPDRYLLGWLSHGTTILNLERISGPTKTERRNKATMGKYIKRMRSLKKGLSRWQELVETENSKGIMFKEYAARKVIIPALALIHLVLLIYLYIADVTPWGWVGVLAIILGGGLILASFRWRLKRYIIIFLVVCFFVAAPILYDPLVDEYLNFVILSFLFVGFLPRGALDQRSAAYLSAIKRYRRKLARGGHGEGRGEYDRNRLEKMREDALLLGVGERFMRKVSKENPNFIFSEASSLFDKDVDTAIDYVFIHSWKGISDGTSSGRNSSNGDGGADGGSSYDYSSDGGYDGGSGDGGGGGD
ncbi:DUF2207 domain-containing protein [Paenibacillus sp. FSL W7-1279]|uniref:DUF2207 domain-containing protein n=1 Tax=Paenibacillus sp. FSL W7-1279 TaxID=2921697 RepID=UPI0030DB7C8A